MEQSLSQLHVLVVDDDQCVLDMVELLLSSLGLRDVLTTTDANAALRIVEAADSNIDVILCDLDMPEMDGIQFLRHLTESPYKGSVAIISGACAKVINSVEKLANTHNLRFLGYLEKHHLDASLLSTLLSRVHDVEVSGSKVKETGFQEWEIRQAISKGELCVFYQPKVSLKTNKVVGVEALVRWNHPSQGLIGPNQFIAAAEKYGLIDKLGYCIAKQAIEALGEWNSIGRDLGLAINLSVKSLYQLDLPEKLMEYLEGSGIDPQRLTLEVTESQVLEELSAPMEILTRLCLRGLGLSIDDFGTGYASLEQLNRLPFTELKIDQSFVQQAPNEESARIILETSISMAKRLGMKIVAEGVEDKSMLDLVKSLGCDEVQGFYIAKPMPRELFEEWLATRDKKALEIT